MAAWPKMAGLLCPEAREEQAPVSRVDQGPDRLELDRLELDRLDRSLNKYE